MRKKKTNKRNSSSATCSFSKRNQTLGGFSLYVQRFGFHENAPSGRLDGWQAGPDPQGTSPHEMRVWTAGRPDLTPRAHLHTRCVRLDMIPWDHDILYTPTRSCNATIRAVWCLHSRRPLSRPEVSRQHARREPEGVSCTQRSTKGLIVN